MNILLIPVFIPIFAALFILLLSEKTKYIKEIATIMSSLIAVLASAAIFGADSLLYSLPWAGYGFDFRLNTDALNRFILLAANSFAFLTAFYALGFLKKKKISIKWFCFNLLFTEGFSSGAILSDNLLLLLFFWEGLLIFIYSFIALSKENSMSTNTAMKAFIINAIADLCFLVGITITGFIAGTMNMSEIYSSKLILSGWAAAGYALLLIGAVSKTGGMPFHTWIPDASVDGNAAFMAYVPAALNKLLGIYLLVRISVYLYSLNGAAQLIIMSVGAITLLLAVMMALVQTDYKKLLSYIAVSQSGYMILAIGTLNPLGIAGGLFLMLNNAIYQSALFFTAGSVENQAGSTDIKKLGGLARKMPFTALVFIIAALSISGVPPFNGFFSKGMIERGIFQAGYPLLFFIAEAGFILTLMSFLKLGHAVYFGKRPEHLSKTKESGFSLLFPMLILAAACVVFGFGAKIPTNYFLEPIMKLLALQHAEYFAGFYFNNLFLLTLIVMILAFISHIVGAKLGGNKASNASDLVRRAPVLKNIYAMAERRLLDPYEQAMKSLFPRIGTVLFKTDRFMDYITGALPSFTLNYFSKMSRKFHDGRYPLYMAIAIFGFLAYLAYIFNFGGIR